MKLIRYFGLSNSVVIPREYEVISGCFFDDRWRWLTITFEAGTKMTRICDRAFDECETLKSICIPASVTFLGAECFDRCQRLSQVTFETGSQLTEIGPSAFRCCHSLKSICIPALVECIPESCFANCMSLSTVSFESEAKLGRICYWAFGGCASLRSFTLPGQLEILESKSFDLNTALLGLIFEIPSRMKQLCLRRVCIDCLAIPDSVEFLSGLFELFDGRAPLLQFGGESRLKEIEFDPRKRDPCSMRYSLPCHRIFVCLAEGVLRRLRIKFQGM
jgi:hypothetical protein